MALRLVSTSPSAADAPSSAATPARDIRADVLEAATLLGRGEIDAWREHVGGFSTIDGEHDRYVARSAAVRQVLGARDVAPARLAAMLTAAADVLLDALDENPAEPVLLNWAGVVLFELGATKAAAALFAAAQRLDPSLPDVGANLRACRSRRGGDAIMRGLAPRLQRRLRTLVPRAGRIADRARPATGLTLSLCMIVKDEEEMLPRCLAAIAPFVDELIVVDTGSTDATVAVAESFGARVLHHSWTGDFAAARNVGLDAATGDWMMYLDADEVLVDGEGPKLRELLGHTWREAVYVIETNFTGEVEHGTSVDHNALRIFRNRPEYRFRDRIHEQIAYALPSIPERLEQSTVRIEHYGYLGVVREQRDKSRRNLELLEQQVAEGVDNAFLHYNLGSEYLAIDRFDEARRHFGRAWELLAADAERLEYPYFPSLAGRYVRVLRSQGDLAAVAALAAEVLELLPGYTDIVLEHALAAAAAGERELAERLYREAIALGDAPTRYVGARGAGTFMARHALAQLLREAGRVPEAVELLIAALTDNPAFLIALQPLVQCRLALGDDAAAVRREVTDLVGDLTPASTFVLAVPFYEAGEIEVAEGLLRESLSGRPDSSRARLALVEALLSRAAFADAEREADRIAADTPDGALAARSRLFATVADPAHDAPRMDASRAYARAAGMAGAELAMFEAWWSGATDGPLDAALAPLIGVMLEALTRIEAFDQFETLAGVLEQTTLPWRERRELMASVYLRRGFLESAADEWIGVVETSGPDRRALLGLATVADLRELPEDAAFLRGEAETLAA